MAFVFPAVAHDVVLRVDIDLAAGFSSMQLWDRAAHLVDHNRLSLAVPCVPAAVHHANFVHWEAVSFAFGDFHVEVLVR